jgi:hypothetical protein
MARKDDHDPNPGLGGPDLDGRLPDLRRGGAEVEEGKGSQRKEKEGK